MIIWTITVQKKIYIRLLKQFVGNIKEGGKAVLCFDNAKVRRLAAETDKEVITYGVEGEGADYIARDISYGVDGTSYKLYYKGEFVTEVHLIVPGRHNVLNSMGAFAAAHEMGIATDKILASLKNVRRCQTSF